MTPKESVSLSKQKKYWYKILKNEGFRDIEGGKEMDPGLYNQKFTFGLDQPQHVRDRNLNTFEINRLDIKLLGIKEPLRSFAESIEAYYNQAQTLAENWPWRMWCKSKLDTLERRIWYLHAYGMTGPEIFKLLKKEKRLLKGRIGSRESINRVIKRYAMIARLIDYTRLETAWEPGNATTQILKLDQTLNTKIGKIRRKRQL